MFQRLILGSASVPRFLSSPAPLLAHAPGHDAFPGVVFVRDLPVPAGAAFVLLALLAFGGAGLGEFRHQPSNVVCVGKLGKRNMSWWWRLLHAIRDQVKGVL